MTKLKTKPPIDPHPTDEILVPEDDSIIGRAFRWSLAAILVIVAVAIGVNWWMTRSETTTAVVIDDDVPPTNPLTVADDRPSVRFRDITVESGVTFVHHNGATGERMLPETMGGGVAFFDADADGDQDLLLVNGAPWPWTTRTSPAPVTSAVYLNDGSGRFTDVTKGSGLDVELYGMGVACGDYDNDGRVDLFIATVGADRLFRNETEGGVVRFTDVTAAAGVGGADDQWSSSAGFFDADNDGDLDLMVCHYVRWSRRIDLDLNFTLNGTDRAYGPPSNYQGAFCSFYRQDGDGVFRDVSESAGMHVTNVSTGVPVGKSLGLVPIDLNGDGLLDVVVANDTTQNFLFENQGDCVFREVGAASGVAYDGQGSSTGGMGVDVAHFRNDDEIAIGIGNFANEMSSFYVRQGSSLLFSDDAAVEGIGSPSRKALSFGLFFFDFDLDGRLDLLQANGHLEEEINQIQSSQHYEQPAQLFWNRGGDADTTYLLVPGAETGDLAEPLVGRGAAYADIDADGDLDVILTQSGRRPVLLVNEVTGRHWLRVRLTGTASNRDAIGSRVQLRRGDMTQRRLVMPTRSYLSQVELPVTFGLGRDPVVDELSVVWPDGTRQIVPVECVDCEINVVQTR